MCVMGRKQQTNALLLLLAAPFLLVVACCGSCGLFSNRRDPPAVANQSPPSPPAVTKRASSPSTVRAERDGSQGGSQPFVPPAAPTKPFADPFTAKPANSPPLEAEAAAVPLPTVADPVLPGLREWTSKQGKFHISAQFVGFTAGSIKLKKPDDTTIDVQLDKLSSADQQHVAEILRIDPAANVLFGRVVEVIDGDTITLLDGGKKQHRIRLEGIDSPEGGQAFGQAAKQALSEKVFDVTLWAEWKAKDKYDRTLAHLYVDGRHVNLEMVADGYGWHYKEYSKDPRLANAELVARQRKLGLWRDTNPIPPWDYRRGVR